MIFLFLLPLYLAVVIYMLVRFFHWLCCPFPGKERLRQVKRKRRNTENPGLSRAEAEESLLHVLTPQNTRNRHRRRRRMLPCLPL